MNGKQLGLPLWAAGGIGVACITAGGVVAAATEPLKLQHGSWLAAYLVLVCGLAEIALAAGGILLAKVLPSVRTAVLAAGAFNLGNAAVIVGTVSGLTLILDVGAVLLVVALVGFGWVVRGSAPAQRWLLWLYRILIVILIVSIPTGLVIAQLKA